MRASTAVERARLGAMLDACIGGPDSALDAIAVEAANRDDLSLAELCRRLLAQRLAANVDDGLGGRDLLDKSLSATMLAIGVVLAEVEI